MRQIRRSPRQRFIMDLEDDMGFVRVAGGVEVPEVGGIGAVVVPVVGAVANCHDQIESQVPSARHDLVHFRDFVAGGGAARVGIIRIKNFRVKMHGVHAEILYLRNLVGGGR